MNINYVRAPLTSDAVVLENESVTSVVLEDGLEISIVTGRAVDGKELNGLMWSTCLFHILPSLNSIW